MTRIGVTGHTNLTSQTEPLIYQAIHGHLMSYQGGEVLGLTCLARGADQIFAKAMLNIGGQIEVILPSRNYPEKVVKPNNRAQFDDLLSRAVEIIYMPFDDPGREAYMAASETLVARSETMLAVWDGKPAGGHGGTADVVEYAVAHRRDVIIIWPHGAERD